jgi:hypothetical protein
VLKFLRTDIQAILPEGDQVPVTLTGTVGPDFRAFSATDHIRTFRPTVMHPKGGEAFYPGQVVDVVWTTPADVDARTVDVRWSADDGETWQPVALGIPDVQGVSWEVPFLYTDFGRIEVALYDGSGDLIGVGISQDPFFLMSQTVPVVMQGVDVGMDGSAGRLQWRVADLGELEGFHVLRATEEDGEYQEVSEELVTPRYDSQGPVFVFEDDSIFGNRDYYYKLREDRSRGTAFEHGPYRLNWELRNELFQNTPNTFNPRTTIAFSLAQDGPTRLAVYNVAGRLVDVLVDEVLRADTYDVVWEGRDARGREVASGVYLYLLTAPGFEAAKKMTLVR